MPVIGDGITCFQCGDEMPYRKRRFGAKRFCSTQCSSIYHAREHKLKSGWVKRINKIKEMLADGATLQICGDEFGITRERARQLIKSIHLDYDKIIQTRRGIRKVNEALREYIFKRRNCAWCLKELPQESGSKYCDEKCRNNKVRQFQRKKGKERYRATHDVKRTRSLSRKTEKNGSGSPKKRQFFRGVRIATITRIAAIRRNKRKNNPSSGQSKDSNANKTKTHGGKKSNVTK